MKVGMTGVHEIEPPGRCVFFSFRQNCQNRFIGCIFSNAAFNKSDLIVGGAKMCGFCCRSSVRFDG
jgi:hypothetical protein